jgi:hypothetical protein
VLPFARRFAGVAALLLVTFALAVGLGPHPGPETSSVVVATLVPGPEADAAVRFTPDRPGPRHTQEAAMKATSAFDPALVAALAQRESLVPKGPRVGLLLQVTNRAGRPLTLEVGGDRTELRLDLRGPGVVTRSGPGVRGGGELPFLSRRSVRLVPGASYLLPIPYLVGGSRGRLRGVYWDRPGRYTLTASYRVGAVEGRARRDLYVEGPPRVIDVKPQ